MACHFLSWYHPYRARTPIAARTAGHGHTFPEVQIRYAPIGVLYSRRHLFLSATAT